MPSGAVPCLSENGQGERARRGHATATLAVGWWSVPSDGCGFREILNEGGNKESPLKAAKAGTSELFSVPHFSDRRPRDRDRDRRGETWGFSRTGTDPYLVVVFGSNFLFFVVVSICFCLNDGWLCWTWQSVNLGSGRRVWSQGITSTRGAPLTSTLTTVRFCDSIFFSVFDWVIEL